MKRTALLVCCLVSIFTQSEAGSSLPPPTIHGALYLDASRTNFAEIGSAMVRFGEYDPDDAKGGEFLLDSGSAARVRDCSDSKYLCTQVSNMVFAVPLAIMTNTAAFVANGASIKLLKCYRTSNGNCIVALFRSDCRWMNVDRCFATMSAEKDTHRGPLVYFVFSRRYGVTAFGRGDQPVSVGEAERIAQFYILHGDMGILGSRPATQNWSPDATHEGVHQVGR